ncbi:MAG: HAMP domain-containing histidine kinase [Candidatus Hydrogenedentes bacterium]|nr:HAMP domain-containing histidine kinase [Candidatus Hydrogenedentota bacterium]
MDSNSSGEEQVLVQQRKLNELLQYFKVGRCVNGVSHDVNNCLGAILAYAELANLDTRLGPETRRMVIKITEAVERASALVTELTNVARPLKNSVNIIDLRQLVRGILMVRDYDLRIRQVEIASDLDETPSLSGDAARLRLALLYLLMNAEEALQNSEKRRIRITLRAEAQGIAFEIWDSGPGVDGQNVDKIFEPFFTTKGALHLGLGLCTARATIEQHGGTLRYEPQRGFVAFLPYAGLPT